MGRLAGEPHALEEQTAGSLAPNIDTVVLIVVLSVATLVLLISWRRDPAWTRVHLPANLVLADNTTRALAALVRNALDASSEPQSVALSAVRTDQSLEFAVEDSGCGMSVETRARELVHAGLIAWSGRKLKRARPIARTSGKRTVAGLLLEDRE